MKQLTENDVQRLLGGRDWPAGNYAGLLLAQRLSDHIQQTHSDGEWASIFLLAGGIHHEGFDRAWKELGTFNAHHTPEELLELVRKEQCNDETDKE